jgi:uroporphyrinogen decarboxylase
MTKLRNDLLLRTLRGESTERTPVWMMRQAGRYLPDYIKLRKQYSFFERCQTPELAAEITIQPVEQIGVDAAIIFSDILVVPQAMGMEVQLIESRGPFCPSRSKRLRRPGKLLVPDVEEGWDMCSKHCGSPKRHLDGRVPLIGFAGRRGRCCVIWCKGREQDF